MPVMPIRRDVPLVAVIALSLLASVGGAAVRLVTAGQSMTAAATAWLAGLDATQRSRAVVEFEAADVIESLIREEAGFGESDGEGQVCFDGVRRGDSRVGMES